MVIITSGAWWGFKKTVSSAMVFSIKNFLKSQSPKFVIFGTFSFAVTRTSLGLKSPCTMGLLMLWRLAIPWQSNMAYHNSFCRSIIFESEIDKSKYFCRTETLAMPTAILILSSGLRRLGHKLGFFIRVSRSVPSTCSRIWSGEWILSRILDKALTTHHPYFLSKVIIGCSQVPDKMYSMGFSEIRRKKSFCLFNMRLHLIKNKEWVLFQDCSNPPPSSPFWWSLELLALWWWLTPWWQQDGPGAQTNSKLQFSTFLWI